MKEYDFSFPSQGPLPSFPKPIICHVVEPDSISGDTGVMLCAHGWGNSRYQTLEQMQYAAKEFGILSVSPEYRMSGFDYDPINGHGWYQPYDLSFRQTFDCIQALLAVLDKYPAVDRHRIYAYGTSQGGMIVLLAAVWAPSLFAGVYAASAMTRVPRANEALAYGLGCSFSADDRLLRDVPVHASRIKSPVILEHGTSDDVVPHKLHAIRFVRMMKSAGNPVLDFKLYEGGGHSLQPVTNRFETFKNNSRKLFSLSRKGQDSFLIGEKISIPLLHKTFRVDWSRPIGDIQLYSFD